MKRLIISSTHPLKTLRGSRIFRSARYGVGKEIGGCIYVHRDYMYDVAPYDIIDRALDILYENYPDFEFNCIKYDSAKQRISFQEVPDFDTAREPKVGDYVIVDVKEHKCKFGHSDYIYHHKWLWVKDDYDGFDVDESCNWSKTWLSVLTEPADGNGEDRWNSQLRKFRLS